MEHIEIDKRGPNIYRIDRASRSMIVTAQDLLTIMSYVLQHGAEIEQEAAKMAEHDELDRQHQHEENERIRLISGDKDEEA